MIPPKPEPDLVPGGWRHFWAIALAAGGAAALLAAIFQVLAMRPGQDGVPVLASFPNGPAALIFSAAVLLGLVLRRRSIQAFILACAALAFLFSWQDGPRAAVDVAAGILLGAATGAGAYGLAYAPGPLLARLRWLLWLQLAIALLVTVMAYLDILPEFLLTWPYADKVFHFLLAGSVVFWLSLWQTRRDILLNGMRFTLPTLAYVGLVLGEELLQSFSPVRRLEAADFLADLAGMAFFWLLQQRLSRTLR